MLPGMAYLVRRLLENTSNESFLKASFAEHARIDDLLRDPEEIGAMLTRTRRLRAELAAAGSPAELPPFRNEPPTDFARPENREADAPGTRGCPRPARPALSAARSAARRSTPSRGGSIRSIRARARGSWARRRWPEPEHADAGGRRGPGGLPGLGGDAGRAIAPPS